MLHRDELLAKLGGLLQLLGSFLPCSHRRLFSFLQLPAQLLDLLLRRSYIRRRALCAVLRLVGQPFCRMFDFFVDKVLDLCLSARCPPFNQFIVRYHAAV